MVKVRPSLKVLSSARIVGVSGAKRWVREDSVLLKN